MEEDIEILENYLNYECINRKISPAEIQAIENLIARNKKLEKNQGRVEFKNAEIIIGPNSKNIINQLYISKGKVKEKIEEKIEYIGKLYAEGELDCEYYSEIKGLLTEVLQELLEE